MIEIKRLSIEEVIIAKKQIIKFFKKLGILEIERKYNLLLQYIKNDNCIFMGSYKKNKLIGILWAYTIESEKIHISYFYVDKEFQNKGIGTIFIKELIKIIKLKNIKYIELNVEIQNEKALNFYKKFSFIEKSIKMELTL